MYVECPFTVENSLMGASSGSELLAFFAMMDRLGLIIYGVPDRDGEMETLLDLWFRGFNLMVDTAELKIRGVEPSLPVRLTLLGVQKMLAPLRAASATLAFRSTVWRKPKIS